MVMYPLLLKPALHARVWGGRRLADVLGKQLPTDEPYGESWELHDSAVVVNGPDAGRALSELLAQYGSALIGPDNPPTEGFPLLAKILDAADWLSVQVHPNDAQARTLEGEPRGKTEAWVLLAAEAGAQLVIGVQPGTTREMMAQAIHEHRLEELLVYQPVQPWDVLYIRAGTIHAIGPGLMIYEIQQSSDTTYRLYDWGRMGLDGRARPLHVAKGVQVANVELLPEITRAVPSDTTPIIAGDFFTTYLHTLTTDPLPLDTGGRRFHALTVTDGTCEVTGGGLTLTATHGQTVLLPAALGAYSLRGAGHVLRSQQP